LTNKRKSRNCLFKGTIKQDVVNAGFCTVDLIAESNSWLLATAGHQIFTVAIIFEIKYLSDLEFICEKALGL
jgi:type IV secretory pathway TrbD component